MHVTSLPDGMVRIDREDGSFLGIPTGINKKSFSITKLSDRKDARGWYVHGNIIEEWPVDGFIESDETIYMIGSYREGKVLSDILRSPKEEKLTYIAQLADAFRIIDERGLDLFPIYTNGILFLDEGGVLFLPPKLFAKVKDHMPIPQQIRYYELYNHPELAGEKNIGFSFGVLSYLLLTGEYPFYSADEEELHTQIRERAILSPVMRRPELRPDISSIIMHALGKENGKAPGISEWAALTHEWASGGTTRQLSEEERDSILSQAREREKKHEASFERRKFFRRRGVTIAVSAAIIAVVVFIGGSVLSNILKPRVTRGYSPEMIVQTFYESINAFDHMTMEDCVVDGAGKEYINEVMNLFVITRMRFSVEGTNGLIDAQKWIDEGKPAIPEGQNIFGIAKLKIKERPSGNPDERSFTVKYEKWQPKISPEVDTRQTGQLPYEGFSRTENVYLRTDKGDWVIYRIETVSAEPIPVD